MKSVSEIIDRLRRVGVYPFYEENILEAWAEEIRADQQEIDAKIARKWLNQTDPCDIETAILSAGKSPEEEEKTND